MLGSNDYEPAQLGPVELPHPMCQAGLAGYSDRAMRNVARRRGCPFAVTEALLDTILLSGGKGLANSIDIDDEDHPVAGQIIGSDPNEMASASTILAEHGYDVVDLNFACPVKKIKNKARGGHMLQDEPRALDILRRVRDALPPTVPATVSLRRSFDDSAERRDLFWRIADEAFALGYAGIRVHGRTVEQKYLGRARWEDIAEVKSRYPDRFVWGSGDLFTAEDAVAMLRQTRVDGAWIARGAIGNPWIFRDVIKLLNDEPLAPPTIAEQRDALAEHFELAMQIHGEQLAGRRMRKMGIKYSRFHPEHAAVKTRFVDVRSLRDWQAVLDDFYEDEGRGVWPASHAADEVNAKDSGMASTTG